MTALERLIVPENLYWAWGKVRRYYRTTDAWHDELAVAEFEANLDAELMNIREQFASRAYSLSPLLPLPQPKKPDAENRPRARQAFWVRVRDQVAWVAYVNVIGPPLEDQMPPWSYGNRLYRPVWYDETAPRALLRFGPFRNSPGLLYRRFQHSWPLYRRHVFLTVRKMGLRKYQAEVELGEAERRTLEAEQQRARRLPYLKEDYWRRSVRNPHWAGLDLEKFYPSISAYAIASNIRTYCAQASDITGPLLNDLLRFRFDFTGWSDKELAQIDLSSAETDFPHIPTGLMVAGFLANVAMLKVDTLVNEGVEDAQIAHFRYVDDHVILAPTFDRLEQWIRAYQQILLEQGVGARFNNDKFEPKELGNYFSAGREAHGHEAAPKPMVSKRTAIDASVLDPRFPTPLMTKTLTKVSEIGRVDFDLLDEREEEAALNDLEHLLLTPLPDTELPAATRVAFAATRIAFLAAGRQQSDRELVARERERLRISARIRATTQLLKEQRSDWVSGGTLRRQLAADRALLSLTSREVRRMRKQIEAAERSDRAHVFALLMKAVRAYPEKLRLWERVLEFCRVSGHDDLDPIVEELKHQCGKSPTACRVLRARVLQTIARQMVRCTQVLGSEDYPPCQRSAAKKYLLACLRLPEQLSQMDHPRFYEEISAKLYQAAAGIVRLIIQKAPPSEFLSKSDVARITRLSAKVKALDWARTSPDWLAQSGHSLGSWAWWAEAITQSQLSSVPGPVWEAVVSQLDLDDEAAWATLSRYPAALPDSVHNAVLSGHRVPSRMRLRWLLDFVSTLPVGSATSSKRGGMQELISAVTRPEPNMTSLRDWCRWTKLREETEPFDPRTGEWTALKLTAGILATLPSETPRTSIHWSEFWVPSAWQDLSEDIPRWDTWRRWMEEGRVVRRQRSTTALHLEADRPPGDLEFTRVQEIGLLLLGLLRKDFNWPASWNVPGIQVDSGRISRALIHQAHASSWTTAILEACLTPRQRESLLFELQLLSGFEGDDDTTHDPPRIFTRERLLQYLRRAMEVLEEGQITVHNHQPRQLVPLRVEQISREEWAIEPAHDGPPEDDDQ